MADADIKLLEEGAAEIRRVEKTRGGLSYEVILAEPAPNVVVPKFGITPQKIASAADIEQKLKAAEVRRNSFEQQKLSEISSKLAKIHEAARKKDKIDNEFKATTMEQLKLKMVHVVEKREVIISDIKTKLKTHYSGVGKTRDQLQQNKLMEKIAIEEKLKTAQILRNENMKRLLGRLYNHNVKLAAVQMKHSELAIQKHKEKVQLIENKLSKAEINRERELQKKIMKLHQLEQHAKVVRQKKAAAQQLLDEDSNGSFV